MLKLPSIGISAALALSGAVVACALPACSSGPDSAPTPSASSSTPSANPGLAKPLWATSDRFAGRVDAALPLSVQVHLQMRNAEQAQAELAAISDPDDARYGQYLSDEEFNAKYAPTEADVAAVRAHFESLGITVAHVPDNRAYVALEGTAAQFEAAFGAKLGLYNVANVVKRAPANDLVLPAAVASRVSTVLGFAQSQKFGPRSTKVGGLNRAKLQPKIGGKRPNDTTPLNTCSEWYGANVDKVDPAYPGVAQLAFAPCGYVPGQIRGAYGFNDSIRRGNDGTGVTVAIIDAYLSPTLLQDAQTYAAQHDADYPLPTKRFKSVMAPGTPTTVDTGWYGEQTLDVEAVHTMAPGATIQYVGAQSPNDTDLVAAVNLIISKKLASIVSNSYGSVEQGGGNNFVAWHAIATQAGLKGVGLYFSSGDNGDETDGFPDLFPVSADFPASLDNATAVGGTSLALGRDGSRLFELGWETGATFLTASDPDAGATPPSWDVANLFFAYGAGGGTSMVYEQPKYQKGVVPAALANLPGTPARVVPDVAMLADPTTGFLIGETGADGTYAEFAIGGTSLASPLFAATMALAEQNAGKHLGFANTLLYKARSAFRDIKPATTPQACVVPTQSGNAVLTFGDYAGISLHVTAGYDNVTGLGVPDGKAFLKAIK